MSETPVITEADAQAAGSGITLTAEQMNALGFKDVAALNAKLKEAVQLTDDKDKLTAITAALVTATDNLSKAINTVTQEKAAAASSDSFDELSADAFVKKYNELPADSPERGKIYDALAKQYGHKNTLLVLDGNSLRKALHRPISKKHVQYEQLGEIRDAFDYAYLLTSAHGGVESTPNEKSKIDWALFAKNLDRLENEGLIVPESLRKAAGDLVATGNAGQGAEWIPSEMSANMAEEVYLALKLAGLFKRYYMPTKDYSVPIKTDRGRGYRMPEAGLPSQFFSILATAHSSDTGKVTFSAEKIATLQTFSDEYQQDNVFQNVQELRNDLTWALAACIEDAALNASSALNDLDNAGSDTARLFNNTADAGDGIRLNTGVADCRSAWDGIRKLINSAARLDASNVYPTFALLIALRGLMGKYGVDPTDLAYVVSPRTYVNMLASMTEIITIEKFGPQATIISGELAKVGNTPVIVSAFAREDYETTGYFNTTAPGTATHNRASVQCVNRRGFAFGDRQDVRVETDRQALAGMNYLLATWRGDMQKMFKASENVAAELFNVK